MGFIESIKEYQESGSMLIIEKIVGYVEIDFMRNGSRRYLDRNLTIVDIKLEEPEMYIAYRIKALRESAVKSTYKPSEKPLLSEFQRYLSIIYIDLRIDFGGIVKKMPLDMYEFIITPELLDRLRLVDREIQHGFEEKGPEGYYDIYTRIFTIVEDTVERINREKEAVRADVMSCVVESLKHALKYVDIASGRSDKEIVSYINGAFMSKYGDLQMQKKGLRRVRIAGNKSVVKPRFESAMKTIIDVDIPMEEAARKLTRQQLTFVKHLLSIVERDIAAKNTGPYRVTDSGECRVSAPYMAEMLKQPYETVKRRITRIKYIFKK